MIAKLLRRPYLLVLFLLLLCKALLAVGFILYGQIHLVPDEAQYWLWSQNLDWGFYSKPPGIALQIALGTKFFGNTELGVRVGAALISFATSLSVFSLARRCGLSDKVSFWAAVIFALSPIGIMGSIYATTDWGLLLFWVLALNCLLKAIYLKKTPNYGLLGLCILCGALFKWTIYVLWIPILAYSCYEKKWLSKGMALALLISLLGLMPSVIWNASHGWATFRHVWTQTAGGQRSVLGASWDGNPIGFFGAQLALLSPVYFILLCGACVRVLNPKKEIPHPVRLCGILCFSILFTYLILSCFHKIQGNWAIYAYPAGVVALSWYAGSVLKKSALWVGCGTLCSLFFVLLAFSIPYIQLFAVGKNYQIPFKVNPFRPNLGWNNLPANLTEAGYNPEKHFLAADKYQTTSLLSFYSDGQKRAYFLNLLQSRKNQFSFWPTMDQEQLGHDGYFVVIEDQIKPKVQADKIQAAYEAKLEPYFTQVQFAGIYPLFLAYGKNVKWAMVFHCKNYNGLLPNDPEKY